MLPFTIILGLLAILINAATIPSGTVGDIAPTASSINSTFGNTGLSTSDPITATEVAYDPSEDWHDYSMTQVWLGKKGVTVGNLVGFPLYTRISTLLNMACPEGPTNGRKDCYSGMRQTFQSLCLEKLPSDTVKCETAVYVTGRYHSQAIRRNLIIAAAGAFQAQTSVQTRDSESNCYYAGANTGGTICNVGDVVRVHFPDQRGEINAWNYLHITIYNSKSDKASWGYECCRGDSRTLVDRLMGNIEDDVSALFPWMKYRDWYNDSRCIINGWDTCPL